MSVSEDGGLGHICVWACLCILHGCPDFRTSGEPILLTLKASSLSLAIAFERTEACSLCVSTRDCAVVSPDVHADLVLSICRDDGASEAGMVLPGLLFYLFPPCVVSACDSSRICSATQCALQL
uniref:Uncharacterized protein n=1 Tax=Colobus angolensis palliatus TaxID=336983 RepID=A0A2K5IKX1_COLAP